MSALIPKCPDDGSDVCMNLRADDFDFRLRTYAEQNGHRATAREKEKRMETKDYLKLCGSMSAGLHQTGQYSV